MNFKYTIYMYIWNYDLIEKESVKSEIEIHNFVTNLTEEEVTNTIWFNMMKSMLEDRIQTIAPHREREDKLQYAFEKKTLTKKPLDDYVKYILYHCYAKDKKHHIEEEKGELSARGWYF